MFEGFSVQGRENYGCEEENNMFVQKIFIFSGEGKTPEFLWLNLVNMLYVWEGNPKEVLYYIFEPCSKTTMYFIT